MTTSIASAFQSARAAGRMAFMPFITAGDPDMASTVQVIRELAARKVDLIEIGFPYSDPIADGPVIQASYTRVLNRKLHVSDIFAAIGQLSRESSGSLPPLVAMVAFAIIFRVGPTKFLTAAKEAGFSGLIVPDLPGDEAAELEAMAKSHQLDLIQLIAPTTPPERAERILKSCSGFVYCISIAGTTGVRDELPEELQGQLKWLRTKTDLPLAVGFGISRPDQVGILKGLADGVIVGSAIVRKFEAMNESAEAKSPAVQQIGEFAASMVDACR